MSEQEKVLTPSIEQLPQTSPATPEQVSVPENVQEKAEPTTEANIPVAPNAVTSPAAPITLTPEQERAAQIEKILEEDLASVYFNLPEEKREEFRYKGEMTANQINVLLGSAKIKVKKIISLIKSWLTLIPGVNKFFLEQEAKLKADRIIKLNDKL